eukprot:scaffold14248_cov143-Isochrysis_galbana.AAC.3
MSRNGRQCRGAAHGDRHGTQGTGGLRCGQRKLTTQRASGMRHACGRDVAINGYGYDGPKPWRYIM